MRQPDYVSPVSDKGFRAKIPAIIATLLSVVAAFSVMGSIFAAMRTVSEHVEDWSYWVLPATPNLAYAAVLIVFAAGIARRKRAAWWVLFIWFCLNLLMNLIDALVLIFYPQEILLEGESTTEFYHFIIPRLIIGSAITLLILVLLLVGYRQFYARVERFSFWKAMGAFLGLSAVFVAIGRILIEFWPRSVPEDDRLLYVVQKVVGGAFRLQIVRDASFHGWLSLLLGFFGAVTIFVTVFIYLRSQRKTETLAADDEVRIRVLLSQWGQSDSLGYFGTRRDKAAIFDPEGRAVILYRSIGGVSLASGDPIGDPTAYGRTISAWLTHSRRHGWAPAALGASEEGAAAYAQAGLKVLNIGDEAILNTNSYNLDGRDMKPVRQAVRRIERAGYTATIKRHKDLNDEEMAEAIACADRWRDTANERGFSMALSRLGDANDGECVLMLVHNKEGQPQGLLSFVPWGKDGLSLDLMRRNHDADNGIVEYMVSSVVKGVGAMGIKRISLNFAMFRAVFEEGARLGAGPVLRVWRRLLLLCSRWWQLESLYRSNVKYRPNWETRYLIFGERRNLGRVGLACGIAEGFISPPHRRTSIEDGARPGPLQGLHEAMEEAKRPTEQLSSTVGLPEQVRLRIEKAQAMQDKGIDPYPVGFQRTDTIDAVRERWASLEAGTESGEDVSIAGRVMLVRHHGKLSFAQVKDWSGTIQLMVVADKEFKAAVDVGDFVGITGQVVTSKRGELSVKVETWEITAKCLRPLPNKWAGLTDPEAKVRQRYVMFIMDDSERDTLRQRGAAIRSLRTQLQDRGYLEVETPMLQPVHGGANARPFTTHINVYDMDLYLRIAPELYLKRLAVGGVEKVFELGRNFRNEGVSFKHNPEFTMLEAYEAYADYNVMRELTEKLIRQAAIDALGTTVLHRDGVDYDLSNPWPVVPVYQAITHAAGVDISPDSTVEDLRNLCDTRSIAYNPEWDHGELVLELYERLVEHDTLQPTFYTDFPASVSPLTRQHRDDPRLAERWDLVAFGTELGTAYTELNDPIEQRRRLTEQSLKAAKGDPEAMELDSNFLEALEYAMPPTGGLGLGVDRLVMLLTGKGIRETLPFPMVKPQGTE